jgi:hypothetical protein
MAITITNQQIPLLQRKAATGTGTATVAGTFTGSPTSISATIHRVADDAVIVASQVIDAAPTGGAYSATVAGIPESLADTYYVAVSAAGTGDTANTKGVWQFQVGRWLAVFGQSNGAGLFGGASGAPAASAGTYYRSSIYEAVPNANGVRELLNGLVTRFGVPWGIVQYCQPATSMSNWQPGVSFYIDFVARITTGPNDFECLQWVHGESAAVDSATNMDNNPVGYAAALDSVHGSLATVVGRTKAQCPLMVSGLSRELSTTYSDISWHRAQQCSIFAANEYDNIYYSHSMLDATMQDTIHWDSIAAGQFGKRAALAWAEVFGLETLSAKWEMLAANAVSESTTRVVMSVTRAGDFTPSSGITGFEVSSNGIDWIPATGVKLSATQIELTHASLQYKNRAVRFGYGLQPNISAMPKETDFDTPPVPSMFWTVSEGGTNPIIQITPMMRGVHGSGGFVISWETSPVATVPGKEILFIARVPNPVVNSATSNGEAVELLTTSPLASGNVGRLYRIVTNDTKADLVLTFASQTFDQGMLIPYILHAGTLNVASSYGADNAGSTSTIDANTLANSMFVAIGWTIYPASVPPITVETSGIRQKYRSVGTGMDGAEWGTAPTTNANNEMSAVVDGVQSRIIVFVFDPPTPGSWGWRDIPGETTTTLVIENITYADNGKRVRCIATDNNGSLNSNQVQLTLNL